MGYQNLITKEQLRDKILNNEDISDIDYSHITDMSQMFYYCTSLEKVPENFPSYDWSNTGSKILKQNYPELFI
jgi:hypothetical protein